MEKKKVLIRLDRERTGKQIIELLNGAFQSTGATGIPSRYETKWFTSTMEIERVFQYPDNIETYKQSFFTELGYRDLKPSKWARMLRKNDKEFQPTGIIAETTLLVFEMNSEFEITVEAPSPSERLFPSDLVDNHDHRHPDGLITSAIFEFFRLVTLASS